jgi:hypothetical protein
MRFARQAAVTPVERSWFDQFTAAVFDRFTAAGFSIGRQTLPAAPGESERHVEILSWSRTGDVRVDFDATEASGVALSDTLLRTPEHPRQLVAAGSFEGTGRAQRFSTRWNADIAFDRWWDGDDDAATADIRVKYARIQVTVGRAADVDAMWQISVRTHIRFVWWCKLFALIAMPFHGRLDAEYAKAVDEIVGGWNREVPLLTAQTPADAAAKVVDEVMRPEPKNPESG